MFMTNYINDDEYNRALNENSHKNFCILPFIHFATTTEGHCRLCCKVSKHDVITKDNGEPFNVNRDSIDEIWNSNYMRDKRIRFLRDEQIPECKICWQEEKTFYSEWSTKKKDELPSKRRKENQKWLHRPKTKLTESFNDVVLNPKIRYFDIRLSNLCNLKCRMCWPHFSSQISKEQKQFADAGLPTWYKSYNVEEWNTEKLWHSLESSLLDIHEITFVGGEPTLHDEMYDLLEKLVSKNLSKNIRLKITTNLTNVQHRFLDVLHEFKNIVINGSIDGVNKTNDYVRHPSDWNTVEKNIIKLLEYPNVSLNLTPVVQIYNMFNLHDLVKWYIQSWIKYKAGTRFSLSLDLLYDPSYLNVRMLNFTGRKQWYKKIYLTTLDYIDTILEHVDDYSGEISDNWKMLLELRQRIVNIAQYANIVGLDENGRLAPMITTSSSNSKSEIEKLKNYTTQLDQHRRQSIYDIILDFDEIIKYE